MRLVDVSRGWFAPLYHPHNINLGVLRCCVSMLPKRITTTCSTVHALPPSRMIGPCIGVMKAVESLREWQLALVGVGAVRRVRLEVRLKGERPVRRLDRVYQRIRQTWVSVVRRP